MTVRSTRNYHTKPQEKESGSREANIYWEQVNLCPTISITELDPWKEEEVWTMEGGNTDGEGTNRIMVSKAKSLSSSGRKKNALKKMETPFGKEKNDSKNKGETRMERKKTSVGWKKNGLSTSNGTLLVGTHWDHRLDPCLGARYGLKKKNQLGKNSVESPSVRETATALGTHNWKEPPLSELKRECKMMIIKRCNKKIKSQIQVKECVKYTKNCKASFGKRTISRVGTPHPFHCNPLRGETKWKKGEHESLSRSVHRKIPTGGRVKNVPQVKSQSRRSVKSATNKRIEPNKIKQVVKNPPKRMNHVGRKHEQRGEIPQRIGSANVRRNITGSEKMHVGKRSCRKNGPPLAGRTCSIRMGSRGGGETSLGCLKREKAKVKESERKNVKEDEKEKWNDERGKGERHSSANVRSRIDDKRQELLCSFRQRLSAGSALGELEGSRTGGRVPRKLEREMRCGVMNTHVYAYVGSPSGEYNRDAPESEEEGEKKESSLLHHPLSSNTYEVNEPCTYDHVTHCGKGRERSTIKINTWSSDEIMVGTVPSSSGNSIQGKSNSITRIASPVNESVVIGKRRSHSLNGEQERRAVNPLILTNDLRIKICYSNNYVDLRRMERLPIHERGSPENDIAMKVGRESSKQMTRKISKYMTEAEPHINYSALSCHSEDHFLNISDDLFLISQDSEKMKMNGYVERINSKDTFDGEQRCIYNRLEGQTTECHTCMEGNLLPISHFVKADKGKGTHPIEEVDEEVSPVKELIHEWEGIHGLEGNNYHQQERTNEQSTGWFTPELGQEEMGSTSQKNSTRISKGINFTMGDEKFKRDTHQIVNDINRKNHSLWRSEKNIEQHRRSDNEGERQTDRNTDDAHTSKNNRNSLIEPFLDHSEEGNVYIDPFNLDNGSNSTSASLWECPRGKFVQNSNLNYLVREERYLDNMVQVEEKFSEVLVVPPVEPEGRISNKCCRNTNDTIAMSVGRNRNEESIKFGGVSQVKGTTSEKLRKNFQVDYPCGGMSMEGEETSPVVSRGEKRGITNKNPNKNPNKSSNKNPNNSRFEQQLKCKNNFPFEAKRRDKTVKKKGSGHPRLHTDGPIIGAGVKDSASKRIGTKSIDGAQNDNPGEHSTRAKEERKKKQKNKNQKSKKERKKEEEKEKEKIRIVKKKKISEQKKCSQSAKPPQHCEKIAPTKNQGMENTHPLDASTVETNRTSRKVIPHVGNNNEEERYQREKKRDDGRGAPRGSGHPSKSSTSLVNHKGKTMWIEKDKKKKVKRNNYQMHHDKGNIKNVEKKKKIPSYAVLQMLIRKKTKKALTNTDRGRKAVNRSTCNIHKCDVVGDVIQECIFSPERSNANFKVRSGCSVALCGGVPVGKNKKKGKTQKGTKGVKGVKYVSSGKRDDLRKMKKEKRDRMKDDVLLEGQDCFEDAAQTEKRASDAKEALPNTQSKTTSPRDSHQDGGTPKMDSTPGGEDPNERLITKELEKKYLSKIHTKMILKRNIKKGEKRDPFDEAMKDGREGTAISIPPLGCVLLHSEVMQRSNVPDSSHCLGEVSQEVFFLEELIQKERCPVEGEKERGMRECAKWGEWKDELHERTSIGIEPETVHTVNIERGDQMRWTEERTKESLDVDDVDKFHQTHYSDKLEFPLGGLSSGSSDSSDRVDRVDRVERVESDERVRRERRRWDPDLQKTTGEVPKDYVEGGRSLRKGNEHDCGKFSFSLNLEKYVVDHRINRISLKRSLFGGNQEGEDIWGCHPDGTEYDSPPGSAPMAEALEEIPPTRTIEQDEGSNFPPQRRRQITWSTEETDTRNVKSLFLTCNEREVMNVKERKNVINQVKQNVPHLNRKKGAYPDEEEGKGFWSSPFDKVTRDQECSSLRASEGRIELGSIVEDFFLSKIKGKKKKKKKKKNYLFRALSVNDIYGSLFPKSRGCVSFGEKEDDCKKKLNLGGCSPYPHSVGNSVKCIPHLLSRTKSLVFPRGRNNDGGGGIFTQGVATPNGDRSVITRMVHHAGTSDEGSLLKKKKTPNNFSRQSVLLPMRNVGVRPSRVNIFRRSKSCSILKGNALERDCPYDAAMGELVRKAVWTSTMVASRTPVGEPTNMGTAVKRSSLTCGKTFGESHAIHKNLEKSVQTQTSDFLWSPCFLFESSVKE
eukprot:XP_002257635.1 hypothetical protein, conserved in Plasmodium species [Plasmodium knowlesi strain H]